MFRRLLIARALQGGFFRSLLNSSSARPHWEDFLAQFLRTAFILGLAALTVSPALADNAPSVALETNETLFAVLTAINTCGYDQELGNSDPLRAQIRTEVRQAVQGTVGAQEVVGPMCQFYRDHQSADPSRDLTQYVSLALYLQDAPAFTPKVKQAELPPDAANVSGIAPLLIPFYEKVGLHAIWERHRAQYAQLASAYHDPLSKMIFDTEIYLKLPSAGYLGRQFLIYMDAMGAPSQTNARNYASDYYVIIFPSNGPTKMPQIRHAFLHYELDPLALKNGAYFKRLEPLLDNVKMSPMDEAFKNNISLLVTECLVRAIEARTLGNAKTPEADRQKIVDQADHEGYVLTRYFYDALLKFEKDPVGLRNAYPQMLADIDVGKEMKRASQIEFANEASPELLRLPRPKTEQLLLNAERRLSSGDPETAQKLAQQALDEQQEDSGRALFILAQVATMNGDLQGARTNFERALKSTSEAKVMAWSHIYLGRIFDIQEDRLAAVDQYRAALNTEAGKLPEVKAAAERGIEKPYEPPSTPQKKEEDE